MRLHELLHGLPDVHFDERYSEYPVLTLSCDSREDMPDGVFVAMSGFKFNGADFIKDAISRGAKAIAKTDSGRKLGDYQIPESVAVIQIRDPKSFLRHAAERLYGNPSLKVKTIGITGTNGKTTITYLLESILRSHGSKCAVIGTVNYRIADKIIPSKNTTPGFLDNQRYLSQMAKDAIPYCVMETSSHALEQGRVDGIDFAAAVFTNLTQDHLDYHKDMESYFKAKSLLFTRLSPEAGAIINIDDEYGRRLTSMSKGKVLTCGIDQQCDVRAVNIKYALSGTTFDIVFPNGTLPIHTRMIGKHNVYNILCAAACAYSLGLTLQVIGHGIEKLAHVPGRLEPVDAIKDVYVFIDYAHTEDGLVNVLKALRTVSRDKLIVVFGCGGDRDSGKRPKMGKAAAELADWAIVTSDNPRSEDPEAIINQILGGFTKDNFEVCVDRKEAIALALKKASKGNIILLAGKGHEDYQVLKDKTISFDERKIIKELCLASKN
jgi:UDP-N-acetylmuramoyl-L-alanyl-D-glutamate--2,6-diaminopimelate ligase